MELIGAHKFWSLWIIDHLKKASHLVRYTVLNTFFFY